LQKSIQAEWNKLLDAAANGHVPISATIGGGDWNRGIQK
jgi:hypothetical protein